MDNISSMLAAAVKGQLLLQLGSRKLASRQIDQVSFSPSWIIKVVTPLSAESRILVRTEVIGKVVMLEISVYSVLMWEKVVSECF